VFLTVLIENSSREDTCRKMLPHILLLRTSSDSDRFDYRGTTRFIISSPNLDAYRQIMRHSTVWRYTIPSYTLEELVGIRQEFDVSEEMLRKRVSMIGPSVGYVLCTDDEGFEEHCEAVKEAASLFTSTTIEDYIASMGTYHGSEDNNASSSLLIATVDLPTYEPNPLDAYKWRSVRWRFASPYIVDLAVNAVRTQQQKFIDNFVTDISKRKISIMKGLAGNMFEDGVAAALISEGKYSYRETTELQRFEHGAMVPTDTAIKHATGAGFPRRGGTSGPMPGKY
jgi:hypothetical protein